MTRPVAIVGGGLAGAAAATLLARGGCRVQLIEREAGPHDKICGEFLSGEACADLVGLGLDPVRLGAVPVRHVAIASGGHRVEAELPFPALALSRRVLDEALLDMARAAGAEVLRGARARSTDGRRVETSQGAIDADAVLLATGKHDLRGCPRAAPATREGYVGFKMHFRLPETGTAPTIELVLFDHGYAGLQRVAPGIVNLCLIVRASHFATLGGTWDTLLARVMAEPGVARWLGDGEPLFDRPLAIANLPYGYLCEPGWRDSPWRLGDQAAMTASLTGDGMAIALRSASLAARTLLGGGDAPAYHRRVRAMAGSQVRRAMMLQRGCERPPLRALGLAALAFRPRLLGALASLTRLPHHG